MNNSIKKNYFIFSLFNNIIENDKDIIQEYIAYEILRFELKQKKLDGLIFHTDTRIFSIDEIKSIVNKYQIPLNKIFLNHFIKVFNNYIEILPYKYVIDFFNITKTEYGTLTLEVYLTLNDINKILYNVNKKVKITYKNLLYIYTLLLKGMPTTGVSYTDKLLSKIADIDKTTFNKRTNKIMKGRIYEYIIGIDKLPENNELLPEDINHRQQFTCHLYKTEIDYKDINIYLNGSKVDLYEKLGIQVYKILRNNKNQIRRKKVSYGKLNDNQYNNELYNFHQGKFRIKVLEDKKYFRSFNHVFEYIKDNRYQILGNNLRKIKIKAKNQQIAVRKINLILILQELENLLEDFNIIRKPIQKGNINILKRNLYYLSQNADSAKIQNLSKRFNNIWKQIEELEKKYNTDIKILNKTNFMEYIFLDYIKEYKLINYTNKKNKRIKNEEDVKFEVNILFANIKRKVNRILTRYKLNLDTVINFLLDYGYTLKEIEENFHNLVKIHITDIRKFISNDLEMTAASKEAGQNNNTDEKLISVNFISNNILEDTINFISNEPEMTAASKEAGQNNNTNERKVSSRINNKSTIDLLVS